MSTDRPVANIAAVFLTLWSLEHADVTPEDKAVLAYIASKILIEGVPAGVGDRFNYRPALGETYNFEALAPRYQVPRYKVTARLIAQHVFAVAYKRNPDTAETYAKNALKRLLGEPDSNGVHYSPALLTRETPAEQRKHRADGTVKSDPYRYRLLTHVRSTELVKGENPRVARCRRAVIKAALEAGLTEEIAYDLAATEVKGSVINKDRIDAIVTAAAVDNAITGGRTSSPSEREDILPHRGEDILPHRGEDILPSKKHLEKTSKKKMENHPETASGRRGDPATTLDASSLNSDRSPHQVLTAQAAPTTQQVPTRLARVTLDSMTMIRERLGYPYSRELIDGLNVAVIAAQSLFGLNDATVRNMVGEAVDKIAAHNAGTAFPLTVEQAVARLQDALSAAPGQPTASAPLEDEPPF